MLELIVRPNAALILDRGIAWSLVHNHRTYVQKYVHIIEYWTNVYILFDQSAQQYNRGNAQ